MRFIGKKRQKYCINPLLRRVGLLAGSVAVLSFSIAAVQAAPATAQSNSSSSEGSVAVPQLVNSPLEPVPDYSRKSDYELTDLGARWDSLSQQQRGALLREVKLRMAQQPRADGVLMIRTQRRYGRVYRSEGRYLKIETQVVRVRPATVDGSNRSFGVGFEQRSATGSGSGQPVSSDGPDDTSNSSQAQVPAESDQSIQSPPVMRVSDPSR